jgi:putative SOS response-associated peptidase YedK
LAVPAKIGQPLMTLEFSETIITVCNRFRSTRPQALAEHFQASDEIEHRPRFNVAPTDRILTVHQQNGKPRQFSMMRWGLIPSWASSISSANFNARSETVTTTPSFSDAIVSGRRCLIPADGYYEWQTLGTVQQPYCFEVGEGDVFAFAGLWDQWKNPDGQIIKSCAILTITPNPLVAEFHSRMPVILSPAKYDLWLNSPNLDEVLSALDAYDAKLMRRYPVSTKINNSKNDDPESAKRIELEVSTQGLLF